MIRLSLAFRDHVRYAFCDHAGHRWAWSPSRAAHPAGRFREAECRACGTLRYAFSARGKKAFRGRWYLLGYSGRAA